MTPKAKTGDKETSLRNDVFASIRNREAIIERLRKHRIHTSINERGRVCRLLEGLRDASLNTSESIAAWSHFIYKEHQRRFKPGILKRHYCWKGDNYLVKMLRDSSFLRDIPWVAENLLRGCPLERNPFLVPCTIDILAERNVTKECLSTNQSNLALRMKKAAVMILHEEEYVIRRNMMNSKKIRFVLFMKVYMNMIMCTNGKMLYLLKISRYNCCES